VTEDNEGFVAFWRRDEDGNPYLIRGMSVEAARERAREKHRRDEQRFRDAPFPLYGLPPGWLGDRYLGGGEGGGEPGQERTKALSLVHGTILQRGGPMLTVETATERVTGGGLLETVAGMVRSGHAPDVKAAIEALGGRGWRGEIDPSRVTSDEQTFLVDANRVTFDVLAYQEEWVAWAEVGSLFLTVRGNPFDAENVELVQVTNLQPYIGGTRGLRDSVD